MQRSGAPHPKQAPCVCFLGLNKRLDDSVGVTIRELAWCGRRGYFCWWQRGRLRWLQRSWMRLQGRRWGARDGRVVRRRRWRCWRRAERWWQWWPCGRRAKWWWQRWGRRNDKNEVAEARLDSVLTTSGRRHIDNAALIASCNVEREPRRCRHLVENRSQQAAFRHSSELQVERFGTRWIPRLRPKRAVTGRPECLAWALILTRIGV